MVDYPPYVNSYGQLKELFAKIKEASVPQKFTQDFLSTVLDLKSSSFRPMIPFLKRIGFIDPANVPTKVYSDYRDESKSKGIMAAQIKISYNRLYSAHAYAHRLKKEEVISKLSAILGTSKDDEVVPYVASTFLELCKLADFEDMPQSSQTLTLTAPEVKEQVQPTTIAPVQIPAQLGISYTINLNLPATTDIEVFNAIFKALKENLLR